MFRLTRFLKGYMAKTVMGPLFKLIEAVFELITPLVVAWVIDTAIPRGLEGEYSGLRTGGAIILALGILGLAFALTAQFFASRASLGFGTNLRRDLYAHINTFSYTELDKFSTTSLITRITADVNQAQQAVAMFIRLVLRSPFIIIGAIVMSMLIDLRLSLIFVAASLIIGASLWLIMSLSMPKYKGVQAKLDDVTRLTRENLSGARVVRAFGAEERECERFDRASEALSHSSIRVGALSALLNPLTYAVLNLAVIAILWFGGKMVIGGTFAIGELSSFISYVTQILMSLMMIAMVFIMTIISLASARRIVEIFDEDIDIKDNRTNPDLKCEDGSISFRDVCFSYAKDGENLTLSHINLDIHPGETIGIIGGTGSAKTTLVQLIPRLYDVYSGELLVGGHNVKDYTLDHLRNEVAMVLQKNVLFSGTIKENLRWGDANATDEELVAACKAAQAHDFITQFPDGYDTMIEQGGTNVSGGQKQRLCIARALLKNAPILILDEATSALDGETENAVMEAIDHLHGQKTLIIIAHRLSTIRNCDTIYEIRDGKAYLRTKEEVFGKK